MHGARQWLFLACALLVMTVAECGWAAPLALYTAEFADDVAIWSMEGAWQVHEGILMNTGALFEGWLGRRDWRNYVVDARITVGTVQTETAALRLIGRRQKSGDAFALELAQGELRLLVLEGSETRTLASMPAALQEGGPLLLRLGLFEDVLMGQMNSEKPLIVNLDASLAETRIAGQAGVASCGVAFSLEAFQVAALDAPSLPRSNIAPDPGYFPPGIERSAGARDIMLIYSGHYASGVSEWDIADAMPYLAYVQCADGQVEFRDWFFDTFLFLGLQAPSGRAFDSPARATPANMDDWQWYLDTIFQEKKQLSAFSEALQSLKGRLDDPNYRARVIIMIPHPISSQRDFGDVDGDGISEDFSPRPQGVALAEEARWQAVKWYVDEVERRWRESGYANLELAGYYWLDEHLGTHGGITPDTLIKRTVDYLHGMNRRLFWIPYFHAERYDKAYETGLDCVIMQPNYMFDRKIPRSRFEILTNTAKREYFGVEIEADGSVLNSEAGRQRYLDYLRAGVTYGYMTDAIHAYYQDAKVLLHAAYSRDPAIRAVYDATYAFVKGEFDEPLHE